MERRLAAILAADVAGFSRLTGADEEGTLAELSRLRSQVIDPAIAGHGGRVFKTMGDGLLASFGSVVEAVRCGDRIQSALAIEGEAVPADRRLVLRIGIHVGDVVVAGDDLLGDGVNIAARLEQLAQPGGLCVSAAVHDQVRDRLPSFVFSDRGEQALRNIARPLRIWDMLPPGAMSRNRRPAPPPGPATSAAVPDRPTLAVLPFANLCVDPGQDYFADGITEEIIVAVSRFQGLLVIARNASFTMRGREADAQSVGAELGAEYLLQGGIRRAGDRVRVTVQLVEATSGVQLWAERFDRTLSNLLEVQDEIAGRIVAAVAPQIREAEIERARQPGRTFSRSYDLALRAHALADEARRTSNPDGVRKALELAREATRNDPVSPRAYQALAQTSIRVSDLSYFSSGETTAALREAQAAAERLAEMEPANHVAYLLQGHVAIHTRRSDEACRLLKCALDLNPNDPIVASMLSWAESNDGRAEAAIAHAKDALLRTPLGRDRRMMLWTLALAHWVAGDPAAAVPHAREAIAGRRGFVQRFGVLVACLVELGELDEARTLLAEAESAAPGYVQSRLEGKNWFSRPELSARYVAALRKAAGLEC